MAVVRFPSPKPAFSFCSSLTLPETNIIPENRWLEVVISSWEGPPSRGYVSFMEGSRKNWSTNCSKSRKAPVGAKLWVLKLERTFETSRLLWPNGKYQCFTNLEFPEIKGTDLPSKNATFFLSFFFGLVSVRSPSYNVTSTFFLIETTLNLTITQFGIKPLE